VQVSPVLVAPEGAGPTCVESTILSELLLLAPVAVRLVFAFEAGKRADDAPPPFLTGWIDPWGVSGRLDVDVSALDVGDELLLRQ
jgi:hypothetical protein